MNDACSRKSCMKTCFISTYSTDSRKTSIQLIPEPSLTFPFIPHVCVLRTLLAAKSGKAKWLLIQLSTYLGKIEACFQIKFSRACINHFLRMRCHMKGKSMDIKAMNFLFCKRLQKNSLKIVICACK